MDTRPSVAPADVTAFALRSGAAEIPATARQWASWLLLDTIGIAAGAADLEVARIARNTACALYATGNTGAGSRLLFDGRRVSPAGAAFAGATQIDNLDGHDGYNPVKGHIGVAIVPALIAMAEASAPDLSGPEALAAMVVGYEIAGRAGLSLHATVSDYHTSGAWNAIGVAAVAARLMGLDDERLRQAFGIAEYHGPRSQMMREIANPTMLHDGSGWGAMAGVSAAILAEQGFQGAPAITIEGPDVAPYWQDLGRDWIIEQQYVKPYPICRWAHAAIDAVRALQAEHGFAPKDIVKVEIGTFHEAACLYPGLPDTTSMAQYSLRFPVAVMLCHGEIGAPHISGDGLSDPAAAGLVDRIEVFERDRHNDRFPVGRWADAVITLADGSVLQSGDMNAHGGPDSPFTEAEIIEKFRGFTEPVLGAVRTERIITAAARLQEPDSRFADFIDLVVEPV